MSGWELKATALLPVVIWVTTDPTGFRCWQASGVHLWEADGLTLDALSSGMHAVKS